MELRGSNNKGIGGAWRKKRRPFNSTGMNSLTNLKTVVVFSVFTSLATFVELGVISNPHMKSWNGLNDHHYENTPIQIYWKLYNQKREIFR